MEITITQLIILALASFRLTRLVVYDKITEGLRAPFFNELHKGEDIYLIPRGKVGELLSCHWCAGFWCTAIIVFFYWIFDMNVIILLFATAGLASLLQWMTNHD